MKLVKRTYMGEREIFLLPPSQNIMALSSNILSAWVYPQAQCQNRQRMGWDNEVSLQQHRNMSVRKVDPVLGRSCPSRAKAPQYKIIIKGYVLCRS